MTIIKSAEANARSLDAIRPQHPAPALVKDSRARQLIRLQAEMEAQKAEIDALRAQIQAFPQRLESVLERGKAEGRKLGRQEAEDLYEERLKTLRQGIEQAVALFSREVHSLERLAPLIAREALAQLLGDPDAYPDLIARVLRKRLGEVETGAVVRVEVSRADFPDTAALEALEKSLGRDDLDLQAVADRPPGSCALKLQLGWLEIGVAQQWGHLDDLLRRLSEPEAAA